MNSGKKARRVPLAVIHSFTGWTVQVKTSTCGSFDVILTTVYAPSSNCSSHESCSFGNYSFQQKKKIRDFGDSVLGKSRNQLLQ